MSRFRLPVGPALLVLGVLVGAVVGLAVGGRWLDTPIHAMGTDRADNFIIATGAVDADVEAVYVLDGLSGVLKAGVLSGQTKTFQALYEVNVQAGLTALVEYLNKGIRTANTASRRGATPPRPEIQVPQNPHFMMVTGITDIRRGQVGRISPGQAVIYVAETTTGIVMVYALPWDKSAHSANQITGGTLVFWAGEQFTAPVNR